VYFHIDLAEVRTAQGKLYLFVAIDQTSKFAFTEVHEKATRRVAADFLLHLIKAVSYNDIDHRLTKPKHRWTNGQVERMNRTIKDATVKRFYYETHDEYRVHLADFVIAYNFAKRLKTLM
jgi:transposase InsO family protein